MGSAFLCNTLNFLIEIYFSILFIKWIHLIIQVGTLEYSDKPKVLMVVRNFVKISNKSNDKKYLCTHLYYFYLFL